jgi:hypothetical protein
VERHVQSSLSLLGLLHTALHNADASEDAEGAGKASDGLPPPPVCDDGVWNAAVELLAPVHALADDHTAGTGVLPSSSCP